MSVIEYFGDGDPFFGGNADDRMLLNDGSIQTGHPRRQAEPASFQTLEEAIEAARKVSNRRPNSILGVAPRWATGD
jgi:hypothetical protein